MAFAFPLHRVPTLYSFAPLTLDDFGALVPSDFGLLAVYLNDQFTSIPAALEDDPEALARWQAER